MTSIEEMPDTWHLRYQWTVRTIHIHPNGMSRKARGVREALRMALGRGVQGQSDQSSKGAMAGLYRSMQ